MARQQKQSQRPNKGRSPVRDKEVWRGISRPQDINGQAPSLPADDPRRRWLNGSTELREYEARRSTGNAQGGGRQALWLWQQERDQIYKRQSKAQERVIARRVREKKEWDAEVAQYGEDEAKRRQDLKRYEARLLEELPMSDIKQMDL